MPLEKAAKKVKALQSKMMLLIDETRQLIEREKHDT